MSGMINGATQADAPMKNPLLQEAEQKLEAGIAPDTRENYMRVVVAGLAAGVAGGPNSLLAKLRKSPDPVKGAARGTVALVLILRRDTKKGVMPVKAMVLAGLTLMFHALDFIDRTGVVKIGKPELDRAAHIFTNDLFGAFNITPPMLRRLSAQVHAVTQDPEKMELIHRKLGSVVAPGASTATAIPS